MQINWDGMGLNGTPCFDSLPEYLEDLDLSGNTLTGTPNLSSLDGALTMEGVYAQKVAKAATGVLN